MTQDLLAPIRDRQHPFAEVTVATWPEKLRSREFCLVHVGPTAQTGAELLIRDYFEAEYKGKFSFAELKPISVPSGVWWEKYFRLKPKTTLAWAEVQTGFYLFRKGELVGFQSNVTTDFNVSEAVVELAIAALAIKLGAGGTGPSEREKRLADGVIRRVEALIHEAAPPPTPAATPKKDKYAILGVARGAALATCKKAHRDIKKKAHPDTVADRDEAIQKAAHERMIEVDWALAEIEKELGKK